MDQVVQPAGFALQHRQDLLDSRTCRTSSQAEPGNWAPFQIMAASTTTTAEFSAAIDRIRQRIGTARSSPTMPERPRAARPAGRSAVSCCLGAAKPVHSTWRTNRPDRIAASRKIPRSSVDRPWVSAANSTPPRSPRPPSRTAQRRLSRSAIGRRGRTQALSPYDEVDEGTKRFNVFLADAGWVRLLCQRR